MKLLTKNADYAVRALVELALKEGSFISAKTIADKQGIPYEFLRKILRTLISEGFVMSREGQVGGFRLDKDAGKIKVSDIIRIFKGEIRVSECLFRKKICPNRAKCVLRHKMQKIENIVTKEFEKITIESLIKEAR